MTTPSPAYVQWLQRQQTIKYCRVAPLSIWLLDYFLTLNEELRLMTTEGGWGITHMLYIPARFFPMIGSVCAIYNSLAPTTHRLKTCIAFYKFSEITLFLGMFAAEGLLLIRTMALWCHNRTICCGLVVIYCSVGIVMLICSIMSTSLNFSAVCEDTPSSLATASATKLSRVIVGVFLSAVFFELVVLILTLLHGYTWRHSGLKAQGRVMSVVSQGNMVYTLSIFLTSVASITFFSLPLQDSWNGLLTTFQGVLHGVVASRVLFNLRDALHDPRGPMTFSMSQFTAKPITMTTQDATASLEA